MRSVNNEYQYDIEIEPLGVQRAEIFIESISSGGHFGIQDDPLKFGRITCVSHFSNKAWSIV